MLQSQADSLGHQDFADLPWFRPRVRQELPQPTPIEPTVATEADPAADTSGEAALLAQLADSRALLRAYLRLQVGSSSEVDDLEQDISVALWREAAAFDHSRSFTAWMLGFARIHVLRWRQQRARNRRIVALDDLSHDHLVWVGERIVAEGDPVDALTSCLGQLDTASTRLLRQRYEDGLPLAAIAKQLRLSVATASRRLSRLVQLLDTCIRRRLDRPEDSAP